MTRSRTTLVGRSVGALALALWLGGDVAHARQAVADTDTVGPHVGTVVPPVEGTDQLGRRQTLDTLSGPKGLMLVFSRSADW